MDGLDAVHGLGVQPREWQYEAIVWLVHGETLVWRSRVGWMGAVRTVYHRRDACVHRETLLTTARLQRWCIGRREASRNRARGFVHESRDEMLLLEACGRQGGKSALSALSRYPCSRSRTSPDDGTLVGSVGAKYWFVRQRPRPSPEEMVEHRWGGAYDSYYLAPHPTQARYESFPTLDVGGLTVSSEGFRRTTGEFNVADGLDLV